MNYQDLPVYTHKTKILEALAQHQVIVVESPTGSGKTTQLPVILHEAGYSQRGMIGVTQPRRIAAVSVSGFIGRQLGDTGVVGYKMRFDDKTDRGTKIKIMTDGILLQELKLDQTLSQYSVLMVDEAHERSLNIDFILGLLKRVLEARPDFRVIVSSATINAQIFSEYFNGCPVVRIETTTYPVSTIYAPPPQEDDDAVVTKITGLVGHILEEKRKGDILIFLPGEKIIKDCMASLNLQSFGKKLHVIPLYGRLAKEEQDMVFPPAPRGKVKVVVSTNIAETSVTIDGVTSVIDSGFAKINFYNPRTYTSTLMQKPISKASANQRKGRAGRTQPGTCYRLYSKDDFEARPLFTQEEIYRTDLSEVVLRMAELGIRNFDNFDFISSPGAKGIAGAVENLLLLDALKPDNSLSEVGKMMAQFPLLPRHSRIIVEAIRRYPDVIEEAVIATSFLSTDSPYLLPDGKELEARRAHHTFRDPMGDFMSYLKLYNAYIGSEHRVRFCEKFYLEPTTMAEIANIKDQLEQIVSSMEVPIGHGGSMADFSCAVAKGLIQFVCFRTGKGYQSLTGEKVDIHPGSVLYRETPKFMVAGEIVRTSRMYARSVAAIKPEWLEQISPALAQSIRQEMKGEVRGAIPGAPGSPEALARKRGTEVLAAVQPLPSKGKAKTQAAAASPDTDPEYTVGIAGRIYALKPWKGKKKILELSWEDASFLAGQNPAGIASSHGGLRTSVRWDNQLIVDGEKLMRTLAIVRGLTLPDDIAPNRLQNKMSLWDNLDKLLEAVDSVLKLSRIRKSDASLGFLTLYTNQEGIFWVKPSKGYTTALSESFASLEYLIDAVDAKLYPALAARVGQQYRRLAKILEEV